MTISGGRPIRCFEDVVFARDSALEGTGFEPSVPPETEIRFVAGSCGARMRDPSRRRLKFIVLVDLLLGAIISHVAGSLY
jgi:hypothetical protein